MPNNLQMVDNGVAVSDMMDYGVSANFCTLGVDEYIFFSPVKDNPNWSYRCPTTGAYYDFPDMASMLDAMCADARQYSYAGA